MENYQFLDLYIWVFFTFVFAPLISYTVVVVSHPTFSKEALAPIYCISHRNASGYLQEEYALGEPPNLHSV